MSLSDPIADLLTRIRNASMARLESLDVPASRIKANIVKVLRDEGFIESFKLIRTDNRAWIKIQLKYDEKGKPVIHGIRRASRPGLRIYLSSDKKTSTKSGIGTVILSTSKGILTGKTAKSQKVGGEYLCEVW